MQTYTHTKLEKKDVKALAFSKSSRETHRKKRCREKDTQRERHRDSHIERQQRVTKGHPDSHM